VKTYLVGGAVRDKLMGLIPNDLDYLVLEGSPEEMEKLGFQEVGKSHTIYLHPKTKEEYTLSHDLRSDLLRRDLTINAMAMLDDEVIDYFGGETDIKKGILRHVKEENFFADPLRVYRVARFAAQFPDFSIHPSTLELMEKVKDFESFKNLDGERIFQELTKALQTSRPDKFFEALLKTNALQVHFSDIASEDLKYVLNIHDPLLRFASLFFMKPAMLVQSIAERLKIPTEWKETALMASQLLLYRRIDIQDPETVVDLFQEYDIYRRTTRLYLMMNLYILLGKNETANLLDKSFKITSKVTYQDVADKNLEGKDIGAAIKSLRIKLLQKI
jgi:tRNA nucleotidyltransferase (CCA-adding enzyme)